MIKNKLCFLNIAIIYSIIWVISLIIMSLIFPRSKLIYLIIYFVIFPLVTFILSICLGIEKIPNSIRFTSPIFFSIMYLLHAFIKKFLTIFIIDRRVILPSFDHPFYEMSIYIVISMVGLLIGITIRILTQRHSVQSV